ncbi:MAG: hypothetical protein ACXWPM_10660 [Bdellovibrionota bacterium]
MTKFLAVLLILASSTSAFAMGKKPPHPTPMPSPSPTAQINQVTVVHEYYHDDTAAARNQCMDKIHQELFRQLQTQFLTRGIDVVSQEAPKLTLVTGWVIDDTNGLESYHYSAFFHVRGNGAQAVLRADYVVETQVTTSHEEVTTPQQVDPLGNIVTPAKVTADKYQKTVTAFVTNNVGLGDVGRVDIVNDASEIPLFDLNEPLADGSESQDQANERVLLMKFEVPFPVVEKPRP